MFANIQKLVIVVALLRSFLRPALLAGWFVIWGQCYTLFKAVIYEFL